MMSGSGLIAWIRFPAWVYMAAKSAWSPVPHDGSTSFPPTVAGRGSFLMSIAATRGFDAYLVAMSCQPEKNFVAGQLSLNHKPLLSASAQHQPRKSRWQLG